MRPRSPVPRGVLVATGAVVLVAAGIAGYLSFGYPPWEAAAMTLLTLTTVGFASSSHLSTGVLVFTAGLAFARRRPVLRHPGPGRDRDRGRPGEPVLAEPPDAPAP